MIIKVGERFDRIVDIMNDVFGWNYKACFKGFYYLDDDRKYGAWFPKIAKDPKVPGDVWYSWVNILSSDGNNIYMKNYENPERMMKSDEGVSPVLHITFGKNESGKYEYLGTYIRTDLDPELGFVFEKVKGDIDTDDFHLVPRTVKR